MTYTNAAGQQTRRHFLLFGGAFMERRKRFLVDFAYYSAVAALVFLALKYLLHLIMPFFLALLIAGALRPLIRLLTRRGRMLHGFAAVFVCVLFFLLLGCAVILTGSRAAVLLRDLLAEAPIFYVTTLEPALQEISADLQRFAARFDRADLAGELLPKAVAAVGEGVSRLSLRLVTAVSGAAGKVPGLLLKTAVCVIATVFISLDYARIGALCRKFLPPKLLLFAAEARRSARQVLLRYLKSYGLLFLLTFAELALGLTLLRVERGWLIALAAAALDILPLLGTSVVLIPWAVVCLIAGDTVRGISLLALFAVIEVVRQVVEPRIVGRHVGLPPLVTLMCAFLGGQLFGAVGLIALPVLAAVGKDLHELGLLRFLRSGGEEKAPKPQT